MKMITRVATLTAAAALAMAMMTGCSTNNKAVDAFAAKVSLAYDNAITAQIAGSKSEAKLDEELSKKASEYLASDFKADTEQHVECLKTEKVEVKEGEPAKNVIIKIMCSDSGHTVTGGIAVSGTACNANGIAEGSGAIVVNKQAATMISGYTKDATVDAEGSKVNKYGVATVKVNGVVYTAVAVEVETVPAKSVD